MMKNLSTLVLMLAVCLAINAQNSVLKTINSIKTDKNYIYGEATLSSEDDARELAVEMLVREANNWAAHVSQTEEADLDAEAVAALAESIDLPRGNMVRVFVYVKKTALKPVLEDAGLEMAESDAEEAAESGDDSEEGATEAQAQTAEEEAVTFDVSADDASGEAGTTVVELGDAAITMPTMETVEVETAVAEATAAADGAVAATTAMMNDDQLLDAYLFGSAMMSAEEKKAAEEVAEKKAAAVKPLNVTENEVLNKLCGVTSFYDLKSVMVPFKKSGKITRLGKYTTMDQPAESYLIIYDTNGYIKAVLGKGTDSRENLKTKQPDNEHNYKGCGAIWFQLNEN